MCRPGLPIYPQFYPHQSRRCPSRGILRDSHPLKPVPGEQIFAGSSAGNLFAGLAIGAMIHQPGYSTFVAPSSQCASVCGSIWLDGTWRILTPSSKLGFHAALIRRLVRKPAKAMRSWALIQERDHRSPTTINTDARRDKRNSVQAE